MRTLKPVSIIPFSWCIVPQFLSIVCVLAFPAQAGAVESGEGGPPAPKRLTRQQSFLGIHFDFHAGPDCNEIGRNTTPEMVERIIDLVKPDYIQIDCKGHRGLSSYPTKVGNPAPGFVGDPLRVWRAVTAKRGVALYLHYSGVWDSEAIIRHPDWGAINADAKTNSNATSFWSPYAAELLVPQLRELAGDYGVDGAWIDGECWASVPDYGAAALEAFRTSTGIDTVPRKPGEPHWFEFLQFHREAFRKYLRGYIAEVKETHPGFQLCSNWAFTDHMPEPVCAPVDFLSGDYSPDDSVNSARLSARYLAWQGVPWDLMAWSFTLKPRPDGPRQKTAVQLQREAAVVLALGGGFQAYHKQKRDGSIFDEQMPVMADVARFCRARQPFCQHAVQVPQVALLYSTAAHYRRVNGLFSRDLARINGVLQALLESQQSVEVLGEHHLEGRLQEYPLIVIPEWEYLERSFKSKLVNYVKEGGNLLLISPRSAALFQTELDVAFEDPPRGTKSSLLFNGAWMPLNTEFQAARLGRGARWFGRLHATADLSSPSQPAASIATLGRGKIAAVYFDFGQGYLASRGPIAREFLDSLTRQLFPDRLAEVTGSHDVDVVVNRVEGKLALNLINTAGPHQSEPVLETIPPVGPLSVVVRQASEPARVVLQPRGEPLAFNYDQGRLQFTLPSLEIHDIVMIEPK
jgi:hypothetical protein